MLTLTATEYHAKFLAAQALSVSPVASIEYIHSWRHFFEAEIRHHFPERLLSALEVHLLWVEVLKSHPDVQPEQVWSLAKILAENERARRLNRISLTEIEQEGRSQHLFFVDLQRQFDQQLRRLNALTFLEGLERLSLNQTYQAELFGFVDLPPLYAGLVLPLTPPSPTLGRGIYFAQVFEAAHPIEEFKRALQFILDAPDKTFALVVNHTVLNSRTIQQILAEMKLAEKIAYVSSIGACLLDQPWFEFFQAWAGSFLTEDLEVFSCVLSATYLGGDRNQNALWDAKLRERAEACMTLSKFLQNLDPSAREQSWWQQWQKMSGLTQGQKTIAEWLEIVSACQFNWPQFQEVWQNYLLKISPLSQNKTRYDWAEYLQIMWEVAGDYYLPAPYYVKPRLHIVGFLEAVDLSVDAVWILSADEGHLPLPATPPIFIPARLVPEAQPALLLARILEGKEVYASFVKTDEADLSPLLTPSPPVGESWGEGEKRLQNQSLEWAEDKAHLPLNPNQYQNIKGGSSLLEAQAKCPFKAFASYRLGIREWSEGRTLLDPMQKGILIHQILERFWQKVGTQQNLLNADLDAFLDSLIDKELSTSLLKFLEKDRLKARLSEWLNLEKQRPDFKVIAREESAVVSLSALLFHLRLDRVDELADGSKVVIDYKTGAVNPKDWFAERLEAPQLPLYAVLGQYTGVLYASLKAGKMGFFGEERVSEAQSQRWRSQLEALALEFREGFAEVAPTPTACQYCHLEAVCRVQETRA